ncbi:peptidylprolyl isomerase [Adhaeribacter aquaticus]|uniref:peptidylprolyl isomerase n=1 Tax=Adhaeribacter aquaticus TaxID=299567 RepID=UPI00042A1B2B|nr:peptidylprolyl isomerase [Adhaeribacter aquaticus]
MALINKIREKSGVAVTIIALAILSFILIDMFGTQSRLFGGNENVVGEIAGEKITIQEFEEALNGMKQNYASQTGRQPSEEEMGALREQTWSTLILKIAYKKELDRLGITVSDDELVDMVQGNNVHPVIQQTFVNPQTQQFDRSLVVKYLKEDLPRSAPEQQAAWFNFENNLGPEREVQKYNNLIRLSSYVTTAEAKRFQAETNDKAVVKYVYVPYFAISDSAVKVTDDQLQAYLDKNKERYKVEESRSIEYVTVAVKPSKDDSTAVQKEINDLTRQFASAENDSLFVNANSDVPFLGSVVNAGALPDRLKGQNLAKDKIYGPYTENGNAIIYKVTEVRENGKAAARASHILIKPENQTPEAKAAAKKKAEDLLAKIKGGADFAITAAQNGQDGTAANGGDLGYFSEGAMVAPFEKAVFGAKSAGLLPNLVETEFGYHIVKVTDPRSTRNYKIATIIRNISSSDETRDVAFRRADEIAGTAKNLEDLRAAVAKDKSLVKGEAKSVRATDRSVNNLMNARELVRWAFSKQTEKGDVSPVFEVGDQYVVAALVDKREKGYAKVNDIREELTAAVRNEEKAKRIMSKLNGASGTLEQIAAKFGPEAVVRTATDVTMAGSNIEGIGYDPLATGAVFGLKQGARSKPVEGETGVVILELQQLNKINFTGNFDGVKKQIETTRSGRTEGSAFQLIKEKSDIKDDRIKFF